MHDAFVSSRRRSVAATLAVAVLACAPCAFAAETPEPKIKLEKLGGRPGKLLHQALYNQDGRLGFLQDLDGDGADEFVHLVQEGSALSFRILDLVDGKARVDVPLGKGYPAGIGAFELDGDDGLEFVAAYGNRRDRMGKKAAMIGASVITSLALGPTLSHSFTIDGVTVTRVPYFVFRAGGQGIDLHDMIAFDDDGEVLWKRALRRPGEGGREDNVRFRMLVPVVGSDETVMILTSDTGEPVQGISGRTGETLWTAKLPGDLPPSKWHGGQLNRDGQPLGLLFRDTGLILLDPASGETLLSATFGSEITGFPLATTFGDAGGGGFLMYGEGKGELRMVSMATGDVLWTMEFPAVKHVLPVDENSFLVVWREGVSIVGADGKRIEDHAAPDEMEIKTKYPPVLRDLDGDGDREITYISGKKVVCWDPGADRVLWRESLASFVGGANPVALYDAFHDVNGDGWLDVPAATGGGKGRWLSGRTGNVIVEVGSAFENPILGDWDGDGKLELFWWKTWHEFR